MKKIGIICAMQIEADGIIAEMESFQKRNISGIEFWDGKIGDACAVVCVCGVGKVFAAMCTQTLILEFAPDAVINVGVAGALSSKLHLLDIVVASDVCQHDMDTSPIGDPIGLISGINKIYLEPDESISAQLYNIALKRGIPSYRGRIATGDQFVDKDTQRTRISELFGAVACEMEGGAVAQVCITNGTPFALLRAISDGETGDYAVFAARAAKNSADVCVEYLHSL